MTITGMGHMSVEFYAGAEACRADVFGEWQRMRGFLRPAFSLNSVQNYIYKPGAELLLLIIDVRGHIW